jgi:surface protein
MAYMFKDCYNFNCDLSEWNVSNVQNMTHMFKNCYNFNSDINDWNVYKVISMSEMFRNCKKFNSNLSNWNVSGVRWMISMFAYCNKFEGKGLEKWKFLNLKNAAQMFNGCENFNCDVSNWDMSNCLDMSYMFYNCKKFKGEGLDKWNIQSKVKKTLAFSKCICLKNKPSWYKLT